MYFVVGTAEDSLDLVGNVSRQPLPRRRLPRLAGEIAILRSLLPCFPFSWEEILLTGIRVSGGSIDTIIHQN